MPTADILSQAVSAYLDHAADCYTTASGHLAEARIYKAAQLLR